MLPRIQPLLHQSNVRAVLAHLFSQAFDSVGQRFSLMPACHQAGQFLWRVFQRARSLRLQKAPGSIAVCQIQHLSVGIHQQPLARLFMHGSHLCPSEVWRHDRMTLEGHEEVGVSGTHVSTVVVDDLVTAQIERDPARSSMVAHYYGQPRPQEHRRNLKGLRCIQRRSWQRKVIHRVPPSVHVLAHRTRPSFSVCCKALETHDAVQVLGICLRL